MKLISEEKLVISSKEDLYVMVAARDYRYINELVYKKHTPFGVCKDLNEFRRYLNMMTVDEIIEYRDDMDGNILHDMAECNKNIDFFDEVLKIVGKNEFANLIQMPDRGGEYPISMTDDLNLFDYLLSFVSLNDKILYKISSTCRNQKILKYLSDLINRD